MIDAANTIAPNAWRRRLHLVLEAYRAERAYPLPEPPTTDKQLYDAMDGDARPTFRTLQHAFSQCQAEMINRLIYKPPHAMT